MLLFTALMLTQPASAEADLGHGAAQQLPQVEPTRLEIGGGHIGGESATITFTYAGADAAPNVPKIRFDARFVDQRANTRSQRATDSIACPQAATILRAAPASATAGAESADPLPSIVLHASTYTLCGRFNQAGGPPTEFTVAGRSPTPLGWWAGALVAALNACWRDAS